MITATAPRTDRPRSRRIADRVRLGLGIAAAGALAATALTLPTSAAAAPTVPDGSATTDSAQAQYQGLDARTATLYLTQLDPSGQAVGGYTGQQSDGSVYSSYKLNRGAGAVQIGINVQEGLFSTPAEAAAFYTCDRDDYTTCSVKTDVDGSYLLRATRKLPRGGQAVEVDLLRGDGTRIVVLSGNTADSKYGGAVHGHGVDVKAATLIVQSPRWQLDERPPAADVAKAKRQIRPWTLLAS